MTQKRTMPAQSLPAGRTEFLTNKKKARQVEKETVQMSVKFDTELTLLLQICVIILNRGNLLFS